MPQLANGARPASYGGTQAGAVVRRALGGSAAAPDLILRGTYAPDRPRQAELALGANARPIPGVPVRLQAEVRATRTDRRTDMRPAVLAFTEIDRIELPLRLDAEGYAQVGWVGGSYSTAFADGQARLTRPIATMGGLRVRAGAGAWGGAQKFAERLDVGPTIDVVLDPVRVTVDYRARVAGNASPGNGLAVTLSTGF